MTAGQLVLLVNDIPDHVTAYQRALAAHGFRVRIARTGQEALELVKDTVPECAVIDLRLPDMSAWDLCREMKTDKEARQMPIVVLTPDISKMCAADSAKAGCDAWLAHPTVAEDLIRTIRRVLELDTAAPATQDDALLDFKECAACGSHRIKPTVRMSPIQYYCCKDCNFCWRVEMLEPVH
jgi:CheY-like chemotaxis protein